MKQIRLVHCSDVHLDAPFTTIGASGDKASRRRLDLKETFKNIIKTVQNEDANLLLISGDLYEYEYVKKSTINFINDLFDGIGNVQVLICPGNHDPFTANSYYSSFEWSSNVHIFTHEKPYVYFEALDTWVFGISYNGIEWLPLPDCSKFPIGNSAIKILLAHGTVDFNVGSNTCNPISSRELNALGMDYIGLGHFHNRLQYLEPINIYNPGSPEPLGFDEPGPHGIYAGSIIKEGPSAVKRDIKFITLNRKAYLTSEVDITGCRTDEQAFERIMEYMSRAEEEYSSTCMPGSAHTSSNGCPENILVEINLKGYTDKSYKVNTRHLATMLEQRYFHARIKDYSMPDFSFEEIMMEPGIRGLFVKKMLSRIDGTKDEKERRMLQKALFYGIEALENGKVEVEV